MVTCVQIQFERFSREIEQQGKQHEAQNLNKKSNVNARLKKVFYKKKLYCLSIYCLFPVNTE